LTPSNEKTGPVRHALACPEQEFALSAVASVFGPHYTLDQILDAAEQRVQGVPRAGVIRSLLRIAISDGRAIPDDWTLVFPRRIDASSLLDPQLSTPQFIGRAYETLLYRKPGPEEVEIQSRFLRRRTRSDLLAAIAASPEAENSGGEIVLVGLGRRSLSFERLWRRFVCANQSTERLAEHALPLHAYMKAQERQFSAIRESIPAAAANATAPVLSAVAGVSNTVQTIGGSINRIRTRLETEGAKTAEVVADTRVMQELLRDITNRLSDLLRSLDGVAARSHKLDELAGISRQLAELTNTSHQSSAQLTQLGTALTPQPEIAAAIGRLEARILPPVVPGGDTVVTQVDNFFLGVPIAEWRLSAYYHCRGPLEPGIYNLFRQIVRPGMIVADIGANVGLYTLLAARLLQGSGRVFSFEPTPAIFRLLSENIQLNGFLGTGLVRLHEIAVADREGTAQLYTNIRDSTHNSLFSLADGMDSVQVRTAALDDILGSEMPLDFVKIDVEGSEPLVIRGMRQLLRNNAGLRIVMEFAPVHLERSGTNPSDFLSELESLGLTIRVIDDATGALSPAEPANILAQPNTNLLVSRT
jgi:FkbM family methyltransferase